MRVLLIDPAGAQKGVTHNAGLAFLSGALLARHHEVKVLDLNNYAYSDDECASIALAYRPDWVGYSVKTALVSSAERTARRIRSVCPDARTIVGGPHVGVMGRQYLEQQDVYDYGLAGEGERALPDLVEGIAPSVIPGLIFRSGDQWMTNQVAFIADLDDLPFPTYKTWDRIDRSLFSYPLVHSRGCPYACGFCSVPKVNGRRFRKRSAESVVAELRHARREYVFRDFEFIDDNFTLDIAHAKEVCRGLIAADLGVGWYANNGIRADRLDRELAGLMKRSGCKGVAVGVESANDDVLRGINKNETVEQMARGIEKLKEAGITVGGHFIIGLPGDTLEKVKRSIQFKNDVGLDYAYFNQLVPYPGTAVGEWAATDAQCLVRDIVDASHFGEKAQILMETPEFPKADREEALRLLAMEHGDGVVGAEAFAGVLASRPALRALLIRSGRMDPYEDVVRLLPPGSTLDVLVSHGVRVNHRAVRTVHEYPRAGLMCLSGLGPALKKATARKYDIVLYVNTLQLGLCFSNILGIARHCGSAVYECRPGLHFREVRPQPKAAVPVYSLAS